LPPEKFFEVGNQFLKHDSGLTSLLDLYIYTFGMERERKIFHEKNWEEHRPLLLLPLYYFVIVKPFATSQKSNSQITFLSLFDSFHGGKRYINQMKNAFRVSIGQSLLRMR